MDNGKVKILSIMNPYGYLIVYGIKDIENRKFNTNYRGRLYIHTSQKEESSLYDIKECEVCTDFMKSVKASDNSFEEKYFTGKNFDILRDDLTEDEYNQLDLIDFETHEKNGLLAQSIIGYVNLVDVVKNSKSVWAKKNEYHWVLENPVLFEDPKMFVKGKLGIWEMDKKELES